MWLWMGLEYVSLPTHDLAPHQGGVARSRCGPGSDWIRDHPTEKGYCCLTNFGRKRVLISSIHIYIYIYIHIIVIVNFKNYVVQISQICACAIQTICVSYFVVPQKTHGPHGPMVRARSPLKQFPTHPKTSDTLWWTNIAMENHHF